MAEKRAANFTKAVIEAEPAPSNGKRAYLYDTKESGLLLQTMPSGRKTFQLYKWHKTGPVRVTLGTWPEMTVEQARGKARSVKVQMDTGINPNDLLREVRQEMTFAELFALFMERHAKPTKRTWQEDLREYEQHLARKIGGRKLSTITRKDIAALHAARGEAHPVSANRLLALISTVFGRAKEWGYWEGENPCVGIRHFPERSRDRFLSDDELRRLFEALEEEANIVCRDFFLVALLTGARRANVLEMEWADIDFSASIWRIPQTKNGTPQTVPLIPVVVEILQRRLEVAKLEGRNSVFVFPGNGKTGHLIEPKSAWKRICAKAGIEGVRIHDLRRTFGSWQAITGASLPIIGKSLNHKSQSTTAIYARLDLDPVRASMEKAAQSMLGCRGVVVHKFPEKVVGG